MEKVLGLKVKKTNLQTTHPAWEWRPFPCPWNDALVPEMSSNQRTNFASSFSCPYPCPCPCGVYPCPSPFPSPLSKGILRFSTDHVHFEKPARVSEVKHLQNQLFLWFLIIVPR